jgi:2-dehydropantoate 2-reductase
VADDGSGHAFARLLEDVPLHVLLSGEFATLAWRKLLLNVVANPLTALTLQRQAVLRREDIHALCRDILHEAVAVGRANGAQLADDEAAQVMATLLTYPPEAGTLDVFRPAGGTPARIEALTGAIVAGGERFGIPTPINRALLTLLRVISDASA